MKPEEYKVTTDFGLLDDGTILDCYVLAREKYGLIYHPASRNSGEIPSLELCKKSGHHWVSLSKDSYINLCWKEDQKLITMLDVFIGKVKKK